MPVGKRIWNGRVSGSVGAILIAAGIIRDRIGDKLATLIWSGNLAFFGRNSVIQRNVTIRYPGRVTIGSNCSVAAFTTLTSEFNDSCITIEDNVLINRNVRLDYSGNLTIGRNALISENVMIYTHSHGHDPRSVPVKTALLIGENVWIGANVTICEGVGQIASGSIVATGAVVTRKIVVPGVYGGVPARLIKPVDGTTS
jgi:acetyltransferase-like isoleucine patch superfamily enzyme